MDELEEVEFHACPGLRDLKPPAGKEKFKKITFIACSAITDLQPLASLENLETIEFDCCPAISDLRPLADLKKLRSISFDRHVPGLFSLATPPIESIELGESIELRGHSELSNVTSLVLNANSTFDDLASMPNLKSVQIRGYAANEHVLEALMGCKSLGQLECFALLETNLAPLATLRNLRELKLRYLQRAVDDLRPLADLKKLSSLQLRWHHSLEDLRPLGRLEDLKHLDLFSSAPRDDAHLVEEWDFTPLTHLQSLQVLSISHCRFPVDFKPIAELKGLKTLW